MDDHVVAKAIYNAAANARLIAWLNANPHKQGEHNAQSSQCKMDDQNELNAAHFMGVHTKVLACARNKANITRFASYPLWLATTSLPKTFPSLLVA